MRSAYVILSRLYLLKQIICINGEDVTFATKNDALSLVRDQEEVQFDVRFDPQGYAVYDNGDELRRLGLLLWHRFMGNRTDGLKYRVKYFGASQVEGKYNIIPDK